VKAGADGKSGAAEVREYVAEKAGGERTGGPERAERTNHRRNQWCIPDSCAPKEAIAL